MARTPAVGPHLPAPRSPSQALLTSNDPCGEVDLDDAPTEGGGHHAQGREEATHEHDRPAAKAVHAHAAEGACGRQLLRKGLPSLPLGCALSAKASPPSATPSTQQGAGALQTRFPRGRTQPPVGIFP